MACGRSHPSSALLTAAILGIAGMTVAGCATGAVTNSLATRPPSLTQKLNAEGATPGSVPPTALRPNGTLKNKLLPEQWGDTS